VHPCLQRLKVSWHPKYIPYRLAERAGIAVGIFGAYWLILWSYQLTTQTSYVVALRQFSIVLGVAIGVFLFKEPAPKVRVGAALMIAAGIAGISIGG